MRAIFVKPIDPRLLRRTNYGTSSTSARNANWNRLVEEVLTKRNFDVHALIGEFSKGRPKSYRRFLERAIPDILGKRGITPSTSNKVKNESPKNTVSVGEFTSQAGTMNGAYEEGAYYDVIDIKTSNKLDSQVQIRSIDKQPTYNSITLTNGEVLYDDFGGLRFIKVDPPVINTPSEIVLSAFAEREALIDKLNGLQHGHFYEVSQPKTCRQFTASFHSYSFDLQNIPRLHFENSDPVNLSQGTITLRKHVIRI